MEKLNQLLETKVATAVIPAKEFKPLDGRRALVGGTTVLLSPDAKSDCVELAGLTQRVADNLDEKLTPGAALALQKQIFTNLGKRGGNLVVATNGGEITRVLSEDARSQSIPAHQLVNMVEQIFRKNTHLELDGVTLDKSGTKASIQIRNSQEVELGLPDENLNFGRQLNWDMFGGISIQEYMLRLICSNGMVGWRAGEVLLELDRRSDASVWYKSLFEDMEVGKLAASALYQINKAKETRLSLREYKLLEAIVSQYPGDQPNWGVFNENSWLGHYDMLGEKTPAALMANLETPVNAWQAINVVTDLASHIRTADVSSRIRNKHQMDAGRMLRSQFDSQAWKPTWAPSFN